MKGDFTMLTKLLRSKRGEGYIDVAVGVVCLCLVLAVGLSIFQIISMKTTMDRITEDLIEVATYSGEFGDEFNATVERLRSQYNFEFEVTATAPKFFSTANGRQRVQLGDDMLVTVSVKAGLFGGDTIIPLNLSTTRAGKSEHYWRVGDT